jgi:hypothetical protein
MRYTRIDIEGLPGRYATAQYQTGGTGTSDIVLVTIFMPEKPNGREHYLDAEDQNDRRSMAECLAHHLAGDEARWPEYIQPLNLLTEERI